MEFKTVSKDKINDIIKSDGDYESDDDGRTSSVANDIINITRYVSERTDNVIPAEDTVTPIRLGLVSAHMFDHSIGRILVELIVFLHEKGALLNRPIELIVFFVDRKIKIDTPTSDEDHDKRPDYTQFYRTDYITNILRSRLGDHNFLCLPASLSILHTEISREKLDFLLFADLGMDFTTYALAHARLATYQVSSYV